MDRKDIELDRVRLHRSQPSEEAHLVVEEAHPAKADDDGQVIVVVTRAYCPKGHNLVGLSAETFDGHPGLSLWVEHGGRAGEVVISPIHGDHQKRGITFPDGAKLKLCCPTCRAELPELTRCNCSEEGRLRKLFLSPSLSDAHLVAVCDIWGCPLSRVIDSFEMFSEFIEGHIGD